MSAARSAPSRRVLALASISFVGLGITASTLPLLFPERGGQMVFIFQTCLLLFSGVYYPIEVMPEWMQAVAQFSPATYALVGIRASLMEGKGITDQLETLMPLLVIGAITIPVGVRIFSYAERFARQTGRLKRSG